jgi:hypothetical protein
MERSRTAGKARMIPPVVFGGLVAAALAIFCSLIAVVIAVTVSKRPR